MQTTCELLDAVKRRHGITSDYALAKVLCLVPSAVYNYRKQRSYLDDLAAFRIAELLEIDPAIVIASANAERAKTAQARAVWESILEKLGGAAAALVLGVGLSGAPAPAQAANGKLPVLDNSDIYIMRLSTNA